VEDAAEIPPNFWLKTKQPHTTAPPRKSAAAVPFVSIMYTKYRKLGRKSSHRQALLRNLVTSLFIHESIATTYPKAKEAQRLAEKCITLAKKNTEASRSRTEQILFVRDNLGGE